MADTLSKRLSTGLLTAYGVGIMVGAGIYVLVGYAAGAAGVWAPLAFLVAGLVAVPSALSFAELSSRIPEAAGDSAYVEHGLRAHWLAMLVGFINIAAGVIGGAAVLRGGVGYLTALVPVDPMAAMIALGVGLTLIAVVGVVESLAFAAILTAVEVVGLLLVVGAGFSAPATLDWSAPVSLHVPGVFAAAIFAFFAFLGFDDLVNMAEEARDPARQMPRAILWSLAITSVLYAVVTLAAVRAVPLADLAASERPLALVWSAATGTPAHFLSSIAVAAALNGVLAQVVMAARVLFGLGRRSAALAVFHHAHPRFATPVLATLLTGAATVGAALALPVALLAEYTTIALLVVFTIVNAALIGVKRLPDPSPFSVPAIVPWLGILGSVMLFVVNIQELLP
ncbi:APC family permease [Maritimibacter dapengensis]|uniref:APC family permease n=1 Tax=Maritimibacter dapengensis TaxID=2836868 RepID=A0ABS6T1B1_9RHOB|nr:APC family permease [Maritimibacter dapengensis]MBV7379015.1 APC family permease [Maritimibacter dapengensis]